MEQLSLDHLALDTLHPEALETTLLGFLTRLGPFMAQRSYSVTANYAEILLPHISQLLDAATDPNSDAAPDTYIFDTLEYIVQPLMAKTPEEYARFHTDYHSCLWQCLVLADGQENTDQIRASYAAYSKLQASSQQTKKQLADAQRDFERASSEAQVRLLPTRQKSSQSLWRRTQEGIERLMGQDPEYATVRQIVPAANGEAALPTAKELTDAQARIQARMADAIFEPDYKRLLDMLAELYKLAGILSKDAQDDARTHAQTRMNTLRKQQDDLQKQLDAALKKLQEDSALAIKKTSQHHRPEFTEGWRAVQVEQEDLVLHKDFQQLQAKELELIRQYISENALRFKTRMTRNISTLARHKLDMPRTCKKACATNGVPIQLCYERKKPSKANIIMFLDISGSCKQCSSMMLTFMHEMLDVFPGGCRAFVFINRLFDISSYFAETKNVEQFISTTLGTIATGGGYSNYCAPFQDFYQNYLHLVNRDTVIFFIGDARNNKNPTGEFYIKNIARKARKAYWLNTDVMEKWDQGDSIVRYYAPYMHMVAEVTNTSALLEFITKAR